MKYGSIIGLFFLIHIICPNASAKDITFSGKVIDWETLEPIEGALVVAWWDEWRVDISGGSDRFYDAKETLTDKNGDWHLIGPKGSSEHYSTRAKHITSLVFWKYFINEPYFYIYKPGYFCNRTYNSKGPVNYRAYPYVNKESNIEGIILDRRGDTWAEVDKYSKKYKGGFLPLIPIKDPEKKLRELGFSFQYPDNIIKVRDTELRKKGIKLFRVYTVVGLRKAVTKDDRKRAMRTIDFGMSEKLPITYKMYWEEREVLIGPYRRKAK